MDIEREAVVQVIISAIALMTFVGSTVVVAANYSANGDLTGQGGVAIVGAIGLFVVVMVAAGLWMERQEF